MKSRVILNPITKEKITLLSTEAESEGLYTIFEGEMIPGGSTCLHYHRLITQTYTVTKGQLFIHSGGDKMIQLKTGSKYTIKPGEVHSIFNPTTNTTGYTVKSTPGHMGFENMNRILSGLANENKVNHIGLPKEHITLALLMKMGDTYFTTAFSLFEPLIRWQARKAKQKGIEAEMLHRYCKPW